MAIYAVKTDRMDITLDLSSGYIFVQQKWRYNWIDESGRNPWTLQEKRDFHNKADKWIWDLWSSKAYAMITGNSELARKYRNTKFRINVDIKWVVGRENEHWNVVVKKGRGITSSVSWNNQRIHLYSQDINYESHRGKIDSTMNYLQITVAHEFGHSFGNATGVLNTDGNRMHTDEYKEPDLYIYSDDGSIMSVGNAVRQRHYDYLKQQLKNLIHNEVDIHLF